MNAASQSWRGARRDRSRVADVCLIVEGTYPYLRGGVSSWIHQLITGLPHRTFALLLVSPRRDQQQPLRYELPPNVVNFTEVFIHESVVDGGRPGSRAQRQEAWRAVHQFHGCRGAARMQHAGALLQSLGHGAQRCLSVEDALSSPEAWRFVLERYRERANGTSFIDYFWTWRAVHAPLLQTLMAEVPWARCYHAVSTGYAGLLGVLGKLRHERPLLLTEHGIYVRERAIDVARADWIYEEPVRVRIAQPGANPLKEMWLNFFVTLGQLTYAACDEIITLFGGNAELQKQLGAEAKRVRVIPNGVETQVFAPLRARRRSYADRPPRVGFVGRVVPIKDVKTLLKAFGVAQRHMSELELWVVGPTDEEPSYFAECEELARRLGLQRFRFLGMQDVKEIYPQIDLLVLTSISEGQPLTILEAACAGVPTVATDVGACRELLEGRTVDDQALGSSGRVTRVGMPQDTAEAIVEIMSDHALREQMMAAGIQRVERYYRQEQVIRRYNDIYEQYVHES